jgi:hypothetical protein
VSRSGKEAIVGTFAQPLETRIGFLVWCSLVVAMGVALVVLSLRHSSLKVGGVGLVVSGAMIAAGLSQMRLGGRSTLDDIPVIESLLRDAARECAV